MNRPIVMSSTVLLLISVCVLCGRGMPEGEENVWRCLALPENFQESDLIGIWQTEYVPGSDTDTLVLREDGTYTQRFVCEKCEPEGYSVESSGRWWLEHRASGGLYLHLEGMHRCDVTDEICRQEGGGGGDGGYWDFCEDRTIKMVDEVVLMITGVSEWEIEQFGYPLRGIWLRHMKPALDMGGSHFVLQEQPLVPTPSPTPTLPSA